MKEQYINISIELNNKINTSEEIEKILKKMLEKIERIPSSTIKKYKEFSIPQNNLNTIIIFYKEFLNFIEIKNKIINKLNSFNKQKEIKELTIQEKIKLEDYYKLNEEINLIKKYKGIKMVDEEILNIKLLMESFVQKIDKIFFKILKNKFKDFNEELKYFSYFLIKFGNNNFLESYVNLFIECYINSIKNNELKEIISNIIIDMKELRKINNMLLPEEERKLISLQIEKTIPITLIPIISSKLYLWNKENNWKVLTNLFYIYKLIKTSKEDSIKSYKSLLIEISETINNLTIEIQKQLGIENNFINEKQLQSLCKTISNIIIFSSTNIECFSNLGEKIRNENDLKRFFEPRLISFIIKKMKFFNKQEIIKNLNILIILKRVYNKIGDDDISKLISNGKSLLINKWIQSLNSIKIKENQTDFEIISVIKDLVESDKELFIIESLRDEILNDLIKSIERDINISKDAITPIMRDLYKKQ